MELHIQESVERVVREHEADFALLHADLREAVAEVASRWADRYPVASAMSGISRCSSVRQTMISLFEQRGEEPFPSLGAGEGQGLSVVLTDRSGTRMRVRRWPTDHLGHRYRVVETPEPGQSEALDQARQQALDEGLDEPVLPRPTAHGFDMYVLWWADDDEAELCGAALAAVVDIDSGSLVRILAAASLPAAQQRRGEPATAPREDFDEFDQSAEGSGPTPA